MTQARDVDTLTGLPHMESISSRVHAHLLLGKEVGYIFFNIVHFPELKEKFGSESCNKLLKSIGKILSGLKGKLYREDDLIATGSLSPDHFLLLLFSPPRKKEHFSHDDLKLISSRITQRLQTIMRERTCKLGIKDKLEFNSGYATINPDPSSEVEKLLAEAHKEALLRSNLEKVMVHLISNISHELRTPLTCIKGYAETLLEGAMADEALCRKFLKIINDEAHRLERLINDLLDLSMIDAHDLRRRRQDQAGTH